MKVKLPDNNMLAYIAGLVAADGYIGSREVRIATNNLGYAKLIMRILENSGYKPRLSVGTRVFLVRVYSTRLKETLINEYGLVQGRKANAIVFPEQLSYSDKLAYTAGYFDGDGSIGIVRSGIKDKRWGPYYTPRITISSKSKVFLEALERFLRSNGLSVRSIEFYGAVFRLRYYGCRNLKAFLRLLGRYLLNPERRAGAWAGANSCREVSC